MVVAIRLHNQLCSNFCKEQQQDTKWSGRWGYVCSFTAFHVGGPNIVVHKTPSGFRGQCTLRGLWLLTCHISNIIFIFRAAGGIIWTWRLWQGRPSRTWAWLLFVLWLLCCLIFILVAVRIQYDFSYFISRQHTSCFRTRNRSTLHCQQNFNTANQQTVKSLLNEVEILHAAWWYNA